MHLRAWVEAHLSEGITKINLIFITQVTKAAPVSFQTRSGYLQWLLVIFKTITIQSHRHNRPFSRYLRKPGLQCCEAQSKDHICKVKSIRYIFGRFVWNSAQICTEN